MFIFWTKEFIKNIILPSGNILRTFNCFIIIIKNYKLFIINDFITISVQFIKLYKVEGCAAKALTLILL